MIRLRRFAGGALQPPSRLRALRGEDLAYAADAAIALALAAVAVVSLSLASVPEDGREPDAGAYILALVLTLPLVVRRQAPLGVLAFMMFGSLSYAARGYPSVNVDFFGPVIAYYTVASRMPRPVSLAAGMTLWLAVVASIALSPSETTDSSAILTGAVIIIAVWLFGDGVRERRDYATRLEMKTRELEEARLELAEQAVIQERLRIARDLHDVVAHNIGTIVVQAAVARDAVGTRPEAAAEAIEHVQTISRGALGEIRQLLRVLRQAGDGDSGLAPAPGLADLAQLSAQAESGGISIETKTEGAECPLPPAVDLAAYRIVQEALTNVVKHAAGATVRVTLRYGPDALSIEVANKAAVEPATREPDRGGMGIAGMRERARLLGGSLEAGPGDDGSFRVLAVLPLRADT